MTTGIPRWSITALKDEQKRNDFDCGVSVLNDYLKKLSSQHVKKNVSRVFVAVSDEDASKILGYYSLSSAQVSFEELPKNLRRGLPSRLPIPAARLGRLAVDLRAQGYRVGESLLVNCLSRCGKISAEMGISGVIVNAKNDKAKRFYTHYGFQPLTETPLTLFQPIKTIIKSYPVSYLS